MIPRHGLLISLISCLIHGIEGHFLRFCPCSPFALPQKQTKKQRRLGRIHVTPVTFSAKLGMAFTFCNILHSGSLVSCEAAAGAWEGISQMLDKPPTLFAFFAYGRLLLYFYFFKQSSAECKEPVVLNTEWPLQISMLPKNTKDTCVAAKTHVHPQNRLVASPQCCGTAQIVSNSIFIT